MADEQPEFMETRVQRERERRAEWRRTNVTALVAGLLGIAAALAGSYLQSESAAESQQAQAAEERAREDRDSKNEAYFGFLVAANEYGVVTASAQRCLVGLDEREGIGPCFPLIERLGTERFEFAAARSQVYVWGSSEANEVAGTVAALLPGTATDLAARSVNLGNINLNVDQAAFASAYRDFQRRLCVELPANPRGTC